MSPVGRSLDVPDRLRRLARVSLPPGAYRSLRALWLASQPSALRPWRYLREGWPTEAEGVGWDGRAVAEAYRAKWPAFLDAVQGTGPFGVIHEIPIGSSVGVDDPSAELLGVTLSYVLARAAAGRHIVRVLDWGGALGHHAVIAGANMPELELDYHVKELPEVCQVGRDLVDHVTFHATDECLDEQYDVVIASSTLECFADWQQQLARFAAATTGYVYVTRVPVALTSASFVGLQRVDAYGYGGSIPFWVISRSELLGEARRNGLTLVRELLTGEEPGEIPGAPERSFPSRGFLFAKIADTSPTDPSPT